MNKLLSAASAIGLLLAINAAQAAEVITDEQMDTISAGAVAVAAGAASGVAAGGVASASPSTAPAGGGFITATNFSNGTRFHSSDLFGPAADVAVSNSGF